MFFVHCQNENDYPRRSSYTGNQYKINFLLISAIIILFDRVNMKIHLLYIPVVFNINLTLML